MSGVKKKSLAAFADRMKSPAPGGEWPLPLKDRGDGWTVLGMVSDSHLCSRGERLDVLGALYDLFADEAVEHVYHAGNWIEGERRFNKLDVTVFGLDRQIEYMIENYPARDGMVTHYIAGDDHEGWYQQREQISIGQHLEDRAARAGRRDLHFLGYVEADILLSTDGHHAKMRVMHPGGGATYAVSYAIQKTIESFQPGEKPDVLILGHHHKLLYSYIRGVHAVMPGTTCDQSIFMRKRHIEAHVGGGVLYIRQDPENDHIADFVPRFRTFFKWGFGI